MDEDSAVSLPFDDGRRAIRRQWRNGQWYFSVVDVIAILTDSATPNQYWRDMKRRMSGEGWAETQANCLSLKMLALDGKRRLTDAATVETRLRIIQSIPSPKAEPVKQWLATVGAQRLEEVAAALDEDQRRQLLRGEVADRNRALAATAAGRACSHRATLPSSRTTAIAGCTAARPRDIAARKGLGGTRQILDHMGSTELAANLFRITQTDEKLQQGGASTREEANATHYMVGREVREAIARIGGTMPEDLPTPDRSIQEIEREERRLQQRAQAGRQPPLFGPVEEK